MPIKLLVFTWLWEICLHMHVPTLTIYSLSCYVVKETNYFGQKTVLQCHVDNLLSLEANGLAVNRNVLKVQLMRFLGDNLGSHWLGGFSTNFSCNRYVCR